MKKRSIWQTAMTIKVFPSFFCAGKHRRSGVDELTNTDNPLHSRPLKVRQKNTPESCLLLAQSSILPIFSPFLPLSPFSTLRHGYINSIQCQCSPGESVGRGMRSITASWSANHGANGTLGQKRVLMTQTSYSTDKITRSTHIKSLIEAMTRSGRGRMPAGSVRNYLLSHATNSVALFPFFHLSSSLHYFAFFFFSFSLYCHYFSRRAVSVCVCARMSGFRYCSLLCKLN